MKRVLGSSFVLALALAAEGSETFAPTWAVATPQPGSRFGACIRSAGDVNADGFADVIVGAPAYTNGETSEGRAEVYYGSPTGLSPVPNWTHESDVAYACYGDAVAGVGDVNADGFDDVVVGASQFTNGQTNEGRAYLYLGAATGLSTMAAWAFEPDVPGSWFGNSIAGAGDVNADGFADVIIGAMGAVSYSGRMYVFHGKASGLPAIPATVVTATAPSTYYAVVVAGAGDTNGDGYSDIAIGAPYVANPVPAAGRVLVHQGTPLGIASTPAWTYEGGLEAGILGWSVAGAGDVNGDGYGDLAVSAPGYTNSATNTGKVLAFYGSATGLGTQPDWSVTSGQTNTGFGRRIAGAGDIDADGYADLVVGCDTYTEFPLIVPQGRMFAYRGGSAGLEAAPCWYGGVVNPGSCFGQNVAGAGDVNGDGYSDLVTSGCSVVIGTQESARGFHGGPFAAIAPYGPGKPTNIWSYPPRLGSFAPPVLGSSSVLDFVGGAGLAGPAFVLMGFDPAYVPFDEGTLNVVPATVVMLPSVGPTGTFSVAVPIPALPVLTGVDVYFQAGYIDPLAPGFHHTALTNGLRWRLGT